MAAPEEGMQLCTSPPVQKTKCGVKTDINIVIKIQN